MNSYFVVSARILWLHLLSDWKLEGRQGKTGYIDLSRIPLKKKRRGDGIEVIDPGIPVEKNI